MIFVLWNTLGWESRTCTSSRLYLKLRVRYAYNNGCVYKNQDDTRSLYQIVQMEVFLQESGHYINSVSVVVILWSFYTISDGIPYKIRQNILGPTNHKFWIFKNHLQYNDHICIICIPSKLSSNVVSRYEKKCKLKCKCCTERWILKFYGLKNKRKKSATKWYIDHPKIYAHYRVMNFKFFIKISKN